MPRFFPFSYRRLTGVCVALTALLGLVPYTAHAQQGPRNPFAAPAARVQEAPAHDYDLLHVRVITRVDYPKRAISGRTQNKVAPLRDGLTELIFHKGKSVAISACSINGKTAPYRIEGEYVKIQSPTPLARGKEVEAEIVYAGSTEQGGGFGQGGGIHWISGPASEPTRVGFWTQGETGFNREWAVTWDYPNDFATTETITTVPAEWSVIGNGVLISDKVEGGTRTVHWQMTQPHATYLMALVGGPFDIQKAEWENVPLWYVVPRGEGNLIPPSFSDTPDMLSYFSQVTGVKYAWPKYAQNAMYDFGGGMENVSSTTLGENSLTDDRAGYRDMASLNSHELAHQWFGDLVTCKTWGDSWLNESFATFFQILYFEHSRGKNAYEQEIYDNTQSYLREARRYKRPISTNFYSDPDDMFDSHAYPKGGVVLHTLRRQIGDKAFFAGINKYLTTNRHKPVETQDLVKAMSEAAGTDLQSFFDQWVYKPGHPVLDYSYIYNEAKKEVVVTVKQTQDTSDKTPVYTIPAKVGVVANGKLTRAEVKLDAAENTFRVPSETRPDVVILDPDRDFLREIPEQPWKTEAEYLAVAQYAPDASDRELALGWLTDSKRGKPSDTTVDALVALARTDNDKFPVFEDVSALGQSRRENLRAFWREQLNHPNFARRGQAVEALGKLATTPEDTQTLRALVTDTAPYAPLNAAIRVLSSWDIKGNADVIAKAAQMPSLNENVRMNALPLLAKADPAKATEIAYELIKPEKSADLRAVGLTTLGAATGKGDTKAEETLLAVLNGGDTRLAIAAARGIAAHGNKDLLPQLRAFQEKVAAGPGGDRFARAMIGAYIRQLEEAK